jgi:uncharacterized membrane protein YedE/YeeE
MDIAGAMDAVGEPAVSALGGLAIGVMFGFFAQRSRFCLRAAAIEFARGEKPDRLAIWLIAFSSALLGTQAAIALGLLDASEARVLAQQGSLSGAALGGLMFGCGMVLARGCASRLLVLSANGNLRALLSGLVFAVTAQASFRGLLAPAREALAGLWVIEGGASRDLMAWFGLEQTAKLAFGAVWLAAALWFTLAGRISLRRALSAALVGLAVTAGWLFTYRLAQTSFTPTGVRSLTFSGPSADALMYVLSRGRELDFDLGVVPGVFLGSFLSAALARELKLEGFAGGLGMRRYLIGAVLMGFGAMLAGGCAVGAGVTGASVFALTAWLVLGGMWIGAAATDAALDRYAPKDGSGLQTAQPMVRP